MTKDEALQRAARAKNLIDDPLFKEAADHIEAECWRLFKTLAPSDLEGIAQVKAMQYMHDKYQAFLRKAMQEGKVVRLEMEMERKRPRPAGY